LVVPDQTILGLNLTGLVVFGLYALGLIPALLVAWCMKLFIKTKSKGYLMLELPVYKQPRWGNVGITVFEKVKVFVLSAGKIILAISIVLWTLATYGPSDRMEKAVLQAEQYIQENDIDQEEAVDMIAGAQLENSYIGILG